MTHPTTRTPPPAPLYGERPASARSSSPTADDAAEAGARAPRDVVEGGVAREGGQSRVRWAGAAGAAGVRRVRMFVSRLSLRARLTALVAIVVGLAVAATSAAAFLTVRHELRQQFDQTLLRRAQAAANLNPRAFVPGANALLTSVADLRLAVLEGNQVVARSSQLPPLSDAEYAAAADGATAFRTQVVHGTSFRVVTVPEGSGGVALVMAQPTTEVDKTLGSLGLVLLVVGLSGIVVAAGVGLVVARAGLRPVEHLTAAAEHVARTDDLTPIEVNGNDELARLTVSFNEMLASLDHSRGLQRQLIADAGHELRTPLTSLRTNLDLLAQSYAAGGTGLPARDRDALLADVRAQMEELADLVADVVELAREDTRASFEPVDLADVADRAAQRVRRRAPALIFDVELEPWIVDGDAAALERAVTNLLDNAAKWGPAGSTVTVRLHGGHLTVSDEGAGISDADLPHVFERFYRASDARGMPGSGLGLAIVRQAVERHGGTVRAGHASGGGALFALWLPGRPPSSGDLS